MGYGINQNLENKTRGQRRERIVRPQCLQETPRVIVSGYLMTVFQAIAWLKLQSITEMRKMILLGSWKCIECYLYMNREHEDTDLAHTIE